MASLPRFFPQASSPLAPAEFNLSFLEPAPGPLVAGLPDGAVGRGKGSITEQTPEWLLKARRKAQERELAKRQTGEQFKAAWEGQRMPDDPYMQAMNQARANQLKQMMYPPMPAHSPINFGGFGLLNPAPAAPPPVNPHGIIAVDPDEVEMRAELAKQAMAIPPAPQKRPQAAPAAQPKFGEFDPQAFAKYRLEYQAKQLAALQQQQQQQQQRNLDVFGIERSLDPFGVGGEYQDLR